MIQSVYKGQIKQMSMKRSNQSKQLYKFTKKQKLKDSTSTKDIDDSLQLHPPKLPTAIQLLNKKPHQRTQSCPFIAHPNKIDLIAKSKIDKTQRSQKDVSGGWNDSKGKYCQWHCHSQGEIQTMSNGKSVSIQNLSAVLYRKSGKQGLKKVGALNSRRCKQFFIHNQQHSKNQIEQQIKSYELSEQLKALEERSKGTTIKQQILYDLIYKFEQDLPLVP